MKLTTKHFILCSLALSQPYNLLSESQPFKQEVCFKQENDFLVPALLFVKEQHDICLKYEDKGVEKEILLLEDIVQPMQAVVRGCIIPATTDSLNIPYYKLMLHQFKTALDDGCRNDVMNKKLDEANKVFIQYCNIQTQGYPSREMKKGQSKPYNEISSQPHQTVQTTEDNDPLSYPPAQDCSKEKYQAMLSEAIYIPQALPSECEDNNIILPDCQNHQPLNALDSVNPQQLTTDHSSSSWSKKGLLVGMGIVCIVGLLAAPSPRRDYETGDEYE